MRTTHVGLLLRLVLAAAVAGALSAASHLVLSNGSLAALLRIDTAPSRSRLGNIDNPPPRSRLPSAMSPRPGALASSARAGGLPFYFEANRGQAEERVAFLARARGYTAQIMPGEVVLPQVRMILAGARPEAAVRGRDQLPGQAHYFLGRDPKGWRTHVPTYERIEVDDVYPGINVVYYGAQRGLAFDVVIAPGGDPAALRLAFEGAQRAEVDLHGDLVLKLGDGELRLPLPVIYQATDGGRAIVPGGYVLHAMEKAAGGRVEVGVEVGPYDQTRTLVADPELVYSTYLGALENEEGQDIAVDGAGQMYVIGQTLSSAFPTANPIQPNFGGGPGCGDAFVAKLTADGQALIYATYLGGSDQDCPFGVAVDPLGNAYVAGFVQSSDFPLANPLQGTCAIYLDHCSEGFVTKLSADGSALLYSTYLGAGKDDSLADIAVDGAGYAYVVGGTNSQGFPTVNPVQSRLKGGSDAVVAKLNPQGSALIYSTFLGGNGSDSGTNIAIDSAGNAYVTGQTDSTDFPTVLAVQPTLGGGLDAFVAKLDPTGSTLVYSTYLGGSDTEGLDGGIAVDSSGCAYVVHYTKSRDFPTVNALQPTFAGGDSLGDACVTMFDPSGSRLVYSTYLGGQADDVGHDIAVDAGGFAYVTGFTQSRDFPVAKPWQPVYGGGLRDVFVAKLTPSGSALVFSTYLGGTTDDSSDGIALGPGGDIYVTGQAETPGEFPTINALQPKHGGHKDAFISRFTQSPSPEIRIQPVLMRFGSVPVGGARSTRFFIQNHCCPRQAQIQQPVLQTGDLRARNCNSECEVCRCELMPPVQEPYHQR